MEISIILRGTLGPGTIEHFLARARSGDEIVVIDTGPQPPTAPIAEIEDPRVRRVRQQQSLGQTILNSATREGVLVVRPGDRLFPQALDRFESAMNSELVVAVGCCALELPAKRRLDPVRRTPLAIKRNNTRIVAGEVANRASLTSATELVPSSTCLLVLRSAMDSAALDAFDADPFTFFPGGLVRFSRSILQHGDLALMPDELVIVPPLKPMELQEIRGGPDVVALWLELLDNEPGLSELELRRGLSSLLRRVSLLAVLDSDSPRLAWIRSTIHTIAARIRELDPNRRDVPGLRPAPGVRYIVAPQDWAAFGPDLVTMWLTLIGERTDICLLLPNDGSSTIGQVQRILEESGGGPTHPTIQLLPNSRTVSIRVPAIYLGIGDPETMLRSALEARVS